MPQIHRQHGLFHVTTNTRGKVSWCTYEGIPRILIDNLVMTKNLHKAELYTFCILPNHMHILLNPGEKGLSAFMQSFKRNSTLNINHLFRSAGSHTRAPNPSLDAEVCEPRLREEVTRTKVGYFWQNGFFDERIRDERQRSAAIQYIQSNAARHGLVQEIGDWPWTSLHFPEVCDQLEIWL